MPRMLRRILRRALGIVGDYPSDFVIFQKFTGAFPNLG